MSVKVSGEDVGVKRRRVAPTPRGRKVPAIALAGKDSAAVWSGTPDASAEGAGSSTTTERDSPPTIKDVPAAVEDIDSASADDDAASREVREGTVLLAESALQTQSR